MLDAVEGFVISMVFEQVSMDRVHEVEDDTKLELRNVLLDVIDLWRKK